MTLAHGGGKLRVRFTSDESPSPGAYLFHPPGGQDPLPLKHREDGRFISKHARFEITIEDKRDGKVQRIRMKQGPLELVYHRTASAP